MNIREFLAGQGRTRFAVGDVPPPQVKAEMDTLVREHRTALGLPVVGFFPAAADYNKALDWKEAAGE